MADPVPEPAGMSWAERLAAIWNKATSVFAQSAGAAKNLAGAGKDAAGAMGGLSQSGLLVGAAYAFATSKLLGWVSAGLSGTTAGERLALSTQNLQRSVASAFLPAIEAAIRKIQQLTDYFKSLSGEQQQSIARWTGLSLGMLSTLVAVPKLVAGLGALGGILKTMALTNPFLLAAAGIAALMTRTEEGRATLGELGGALLKAFGAVADLLAGVLVPAVEFLTDALTGTTGKLVLFGVLGAAALTKIVTGFTAMKAAVLSVSGPFLLVVGAIGAIVAALANANSSTKEFEKNVGNIAEEVRKGNTSREQARQQIRRNAEIQSEEEAEKETEKIKGGIGFIGNKRKATEADFERIEENRRARADELARSGEERLERALKRIPGEGRSDLVNARTGTEDARATIRRLEDSVLRLGSDQIAKDQLKTQEQMLEELRKSGRAPERDYRDRPTKGD